MLKRTNLRALAPGQWARIIVPDYQVWREAKQYYFPKPGDEVDICMIPSYSPYSDCRRSFHWDYSVAWRRPNRPTWPNYESPRGLWILPWDFGLRRSYEFYWDLEESRAHDCGQGKWLYEPASDDPELCPGGDWSAYRCDQCAAYVQPWSNDEGDLVCPWCDVNGLVIHDEETLNHLENVRDFARRMGLSEQLERQLSFLGNGRCWGNDSQCELRTDFAPHSFTFAHHILPRASKSGKRAFVFNGGLIYQGPDSPADGSFPSLTVSLSSGTGWFCHT
jgi:hypothetical protein